MPRRRVIVDGYNVIKQDPDLSGLERRGLETARQALLARLRSHPFLRGDQIIVVFDGDGDRTTVEDMDGIRVVFSQAGEPADLAILRLADSAPEDAPLLVLSEDLEVRREIARRGGTARGIRQRRSRARPAFDDRWHKEADYDEEWTEEEKRSGRKKQNPRRPDGRRQRESEPESEDELSW